MLTFKPPRPGSVAVIAWLGVAGLANGATCRGTGQSPAVGWTG